MTNQEIEDLGRRAVACKAWRWDGPMVAWLGEDDRHITVIGVDHRGVLSTDYQGGTSLDPSGLDIWPDISFPATQGCILDIIRSAGWSVCAYPCGEIEVFNTLDPDCGSPGTYDTYAEALVVALEAIS